MSRPPTIGLWGSRGHVATEQSKATLQLMYSGDVGPQSKSSQHGPRGKAGFSAELVPVCDGFSGSDAEATNFVSDNVLISAVSRPTTRAKLSATRTILDKLKALTGSFSLLTAARRHHAPFRSIDVNFDNVVKLARDSKLVGGKPISIDDNLVPAPTTVKFTRNPRHTSIQRGMLSTKLPNSTHRKLEARQRTSSKRRKP